MSTIGQIPPGLASQLAALNRMAEDVAKIMEPVIGLQSQVAGMNAQIVAAAQPMASITSALQRDPGIARAVLQATAASSALREFSRSMADSVQSIQSVMPPDFYAAARAAHVDGGMVGSLLAMPQGYDFGSHFRGALKAGQQADPWLEVAVIPPQEIIEDAVESGRLPDGGVSAHLVAATIHAWILTEGSSIERAKLEATVLLLLVAWHLAVGSELRDILFTHFLYTVRGPATEKEES